MTVRRGLATLLRAYKRFVSPLMPPACRFHPTCSEFAAEAIETHGTFKGSVLAAGRLMRCHPWSDGGFDPVPPTTVHSRPPRG